MPDLSKGCGSTPKLSCKMRCYIAKQGEKAIAMAPKISSFSVIGMHLNGDKITLNLMLFFWNHKEMTQIQ